MNTLVIKTPIKDIKSTYYSCFPDNKIVVTGSDRKEYLSGANKALCNPFIVKSLKILGDKNQPTIFSNILQDILFSTTGRPMIIFNQIEEISIVLDNFGTACIEVLQLLLNKNCTLRKFHFETITPKSQFELKNIDSLSKILKIPSLTDIKINCYLNEKALDLFSGSEYPNITTLDLHKAYNDSSYRYMRTNFLKIVDSIKKMPNLSKFILGHTNCGQNCQQPDNTELNQLLAEYNSQTSRLTKLLVSNNVDTYQSPMSVDTYSDGRSLSNFSVASSQLEAMERYVELREGILWDNNGRASLASSTFSSSQLEAMERDVELREGIILDNDGRSSVISGSNISDSFMAAISNEEVINPNRYSDMLGELCPENSAM